VADERQAAVALHDPRKLRRSMRSSLRLQAR
jgi:hypothetical protein